MIIKNYKKIIVVVVLFILFLWLNNTAFFSKPTKNPKVELLAHRGLAQTFDLKDVKWDTDTSKIIHKPEHKYLENTIASMEAAFNYGADMVEFDLRLTKDKKLVVFHDYDLSYRTNGKGLVRESNLADILKLDIGYGYTHDGGKTYPFRGQGIGLVPTLEEIFTKFPDKKFLIHFKDGGEEAAKAIDKYLTTMKKKQLENLSFYGDKKVIKFINQKYPNLKTLTKSSLIKHIITYQLIGWTGYVPKSMKNRQIHLPLKYAKYLWGWPHKFLKRMKANNTRVILLQTKGKWSEGFNTVDDLNKIPKGYSGGIWTDRIDKIAPYFKKDYSKLRRD